MQHKLNTGFSQLREKDLDNRAQAIIKAVTGNPVFPTPSPTMVVVQGKLDAYRVALATTAPGQTEQIHHTRRDLEDALGALATNLELTPNVTEADLATTGFDLRKPRSSTDAPLTPPGDVRLKHAGISGSVQLQCDPVDRARLYEVQKALDPDNNTWTDAGQFPSTRGITLAGLDRGKDIWARIRAVGANGSGPWSDPATIMVV